MLFEKIFDPKFQKNHILDSYARQDVRALSKDCDEDLNNKVYFCLTQDENKARSRALTAKNNGAMLIFSDFDIDGAVKVDDTRALFAHACKKFYNSSCDRLKIIGISGTNGKTTISHVVGQILKSAGHKTGIIGTNGVLYDGRVFDSPLTTPDADFLHKTFQNMEKAGVEYVIMEVSAHAIAQKRIHGIPFEIGVLTNITQDHLDYFKTMENYEKTKLSFFTSEFLKHAVVCVDDERARKALLIADIPVTTYGINNPADCFAIDVCSSLNGSSFVGNVCDNVLDIHTNLIGKYNVYNTLASLAVCHELGLNSDELLQGIAYVLPVEGRFNVMMVNGKNVVIDFAHSPDGLKNVLEAARELTAGKVYCIFGCGGNRDTTKRAQMGKVAEELSDYVCLTNDNPRYENPDDIILDIERGMTKSHIVEKNRTVAIKKMIDFASDGDIIVIAGKGAEKYQEENGKRTPYNDFDAVYSYFKESSPIFGHCKEGYCGGC